MWVMRFCCGWTVGFMEGPHRFVAVWSFDGPEKAAAMVNYLNGGPGTCPPRGGQADRSYQVIGPDGLVLERDGAPIAQAEQWKAIDRDTDAEGLKAAALAQASKK